MDDLRQHALQDSRGPGRREGDVPGETRAHRGQVRAGRVRPQGRVHRGGAQEDRHAKHEAVARRRQNFPSTNRREIRGVPRERRGAQGRHGHIRHVPPAPEGAARGGEGHGAVERPMGDLRGMDRRLRRIERRRI